MNSTNTRPVVVGVDGEPGSAGALRFAVAEARRRRAPLQLVHVVPTFLSLGPAIPLSDLHRIGGTIGFILIALVWFYAISLAMLAGAVINSLRHESDDTGSLPTEG